MSKTTENIKRLPFGIMIALPKESQDRLSKLCSDFMIQFCDEIFKIIQQVPELQRSSNMQRIFIDEEFIWLLRNLSGSYFEVMQRAMIQYAKGEIFQDGKSL